MVHSFERPSPEVLELAEERPVAIPWAGEFLTGSFASPRHPRGVALIANDRGCARHIPAQRILARELRAAGLATLLVDVLVTEENAFPAVATHVRRDTALLATRIWAARAWLAGSRMPRLPVVLVGQGSAAPAALLSAGAHPSGAAAVVAFGPHPDAAGAALAQLRAPVLLLAESGPFQDLSGSMRALGQLHGERDLRVIREHADPVRGAAEAARAIVAFLSFLGRDRRAA